VEGLWRDGLRRRIEEQDQQIRGLEATVRQLRQGGGYGFQTVPLALVSLVSLGMAALVAASSAS